MQDKLSGIIIPAVTPFDKEGNIEFEMMKENYRKWNQTDVRGYMCLGSNGEFKSLSDDEAFEVISNAAHYRQKGKTLIAGIARESLYQTLRFIERIHKAEIDVDYLSVLTPSYFAKSMTDDALVNYFSRIADYSIYPILLYCAPSFANSVCISVNAVKVLANHPNIYGIKDTSSHMMDDYMEALGGREDFQVLAGSISTIMKCMKRGGKGGVISVANYFPELCTKFIDIYNNYGFDEADKYITKLQKLAKYTGARQGVSSVKCCMNIVGYNGGYPREPLLPVSLEVKNEIMQIINDKHF